ncbi:purine-cytosine permease family protein [Rhodococcus sp. JS3073]|uniref:purine-cytosine permease family protein n=1 Tax=Rhodococcus sp. JS3073 TaxID=3002901 RepID=UPI002286A633|nr:thiamine permease [Rhodococcus sp. JS3073]WAM19043.1 thiamine permease [Rhodococcus sp. JS3073]
MLAVGRNLAPLEVSLTDDPQVVKDAATEDYTTHVVPLSWRSSKKSLSMSWYSLVSGMFYLVTAATLAAVVGTTNTVIGIVLACAVFGLFGSIISRYSTKTGLTVALISQRLFGASGSIVAPLILAATSIYYAVFESSMIAHAFHASIGFFDIRIWYAIAVAMNLPLVMGSIRRWMDKYNAILLPIYWAGLILVVVLIARGNDTAGWLAHAPETSIPLSAPGWLYAFFVYLGVLVLMMFTMDFARFGKPQDSRTNGIVIFGPVFYLFVYLANGLIGIYIAYAAGLSGEVSSTAIVDTMIAVLGGWGLLLVWVTQARINTANFYEASTNLEGLWTRLFRIRLPRVAAVLICGAITYLFMLTDVLSYLLVALAWQGAFIAAWVAILLVHIFLSRAGDRHGLPEFRPGRLASFSAGAWIWFASAIMGIVLYQFGGSVGATWSTPTTFVVAAAYASAFTLQTKSVLLRRTDDPRDEVADIWEARIKCHVCEHSYIAVEMDRDPSATGSPAICTACASLSTAHRRACLAEHTAAATTSIRT